LCIRIGGRGKGQSVCTLSYKLLRYESQPLEDVCISKCFFHIIYVKKKCFLYTFPGICTVYVQYLYASKAYKYCTYTVQILYICQGKQGGGTLNQAATHKASPRAPQELVTYARENRGEERSTGLPRSRLLHALHRSL
jgi:hypothetical protein